MEDFCQFFEKMTMSKILGYAVFLGEKAPAGCLHSKTKVLDTSPEYPQSNQDPNYINKLTFPYVPLFSIEIAKNEGINVIERDIYPDEISKAEEIFLTGTAAEITPVISMDSNKIGTGKPGDITKKMMQEYLDIVMNKNMDYSHWLTEVY